ncbi:DNA-binding LacI/PurR family transcriptional regulator [Nakamurella sp. UYEF19]|uniref:LacI family DNA-binding transcriptional regulator n=1 Tax=Nakamurella sp. UYEF19 TaxID=1756392 RepID=UPI003395A7B4
MPTSEDVARAAGVSQSTVSYVMSGKRSISPATRKRVEQVIEDLGYHPNSGAQALAGSRTNIIGLVVPFRPNIDMTVIAEFMAEIATLARAHDYDILLVTADEGPAGLRRLVGRSLCDALILMEVGSHDDRIPVAKSLGVPVVLIGVPEDSADLHCVDFDFEGAGQTCVDEMADLGHREIALLAIDPDSLKGQANFSVRFRRGVAQAAERRGVDIRTLAMEPNHSDASRAVDSMLSMEPPVTGVILQHSDAPDPVTAVLLEHGLTPGSDIAVIGLCPDALAERLRVPMTTIQQQASEVSRRAMATLFRMLDHSVTTTGEVDLVPVSLARRSSMNPPPSLAGVVRAIR